MAQYHDYKDGSFIEGYRILRVLDKLCTDLLIKERNNGCGILALR